MMSSAVLCFVLNALSASSPAPVPAAGRVDPPPGVLVANAILRAARHEARDDFWVNTAKALNSPPNQQAAKLAAAWAQLEEDLDAAEESWEERLDKAAEMGNGRYDPQINPAQFSPNVTNPRNPLVPGRTLVYLKQTPEGLERIEVSTLNETFVVNGVTCRVVHDVATLDGELIEDTIDWFAQHNNGTVWYFGEIAKNFEDGILDNLDGSWRFGKDDAKPGIQMLANPAVGNIYRQEFDLQNAEDIAEVIAVHQTATVPYGTFTNCIVTEDTTPFDPEHEEHKYFAPGIGLVLEVDVQTGERTELVQIINN